MASVQILTPPSAHFARVELPSTLIPCSRRSFSPARLHRRSFTPPRPPREDGEAECVRMGRRRWRRFVNKHFMDSVIPMAPAEDDHRADHLLLAGGRFSEAPEAFRTGAEPRESGPAAQARGVAASKRVAALGDPAAMLAQLTTSHRNQLSTHAADSALDVAEDALRHYLAVAAADALAALGRMDGARGDATCVRATPQALRLPPSPNPRDERLQRASCAYYGMRSEVPRLARPILPHMSHPIFPMEHRTCRVSQVVREKSPCGKVQMAVLAHLRRPAAKGIFEQLKFWRRIEAAAAVSLTDALRPELGRI